MTNLTKSILFWIVFLVFFFYLHFYFIRKEYFVMLRLMSSHFGYLDMQDTWRAVSEMAGGRIYFKDYIVEYGWFLIFLQTAGFILFNQTYGGLIISKYIILPLLSVALSFFIARNVLQKKILIGAYALFTAFYGVTTNHASIRHVIAEISLSIFVLQFFSKRKWYTATAGVVAGLAVLTSLEYGIAVSIVVLILLVLSVTGVITLEKKRFAIFFLSQSAILIPFYTFLYVKGALFNYIGFMKGFMNNFYYASPCDGSFPRVADVGALLPTSKLIVWGYPIEYLQNSNLYVIFFLYIAIAGWLVFRVLKNRKLTPTEQMMTAFLLYGFILYVRTFTTPCLSYFVYGLVPFFLVLLLAVDTVAAYLKNTSSIQRTVGYAVITAILGWFILTEPSGSIISKLQTEKKDQPAAVVEAQKVYSDVIGGEIEEKYAKQYKQVNDYIKRVTKPTDYIFVYPWGPYTNTAKRIPATTLMNTMVLFAGEEFAVSMLGEIEERKPPYIVINVLTGLGVAHYGTTRTDVIRYFAVDPQGGPVFAGTGTPIEHYIGEHYKTVLHNDVAIVMKRRREPVSISQQLIKVADVKISQLKEKDKSGMVQVGIGQYTISDHKAKLSLAPQIVSPASDVVITFRVKNDLISQYLTRFHINVLAEGEDNMVSSRALVRREWQTVTVSLPSIQKINVLRFEMEENKGFAWWLMPQMLEIQSATFYNWRTYSTIK